MKKYRNVFIIIGVFLVGISITLTIFFRNDISSALKNDKQNDKSNTEAVSSVVYNYKEMTFILNQYGVEGNLLNKKVNLTLNVPDSITPSVNNLKTELTIEDKNITFFISTVQEGTFDQYETGNPYSKVSLPYYKTEVFREESSDDQGRTIYTYRNSYSTDKTICSGANSCGNSWVDLGEINSDKAVPLAISCTISGALNGDTCDKILQSIQAQ